MLVDNWADVKSKIVKGAVNIVRPPRELEGVIDELAQTDARRKAQPGTEAESCELKGYMQPLASEKLLFFIAPKSCLPACFFGFQVFYVRSLWKPKKKASRNPKKRLLEAKKRGF